MSSHVARAGSALPDIDDRLVAPDTRYEIYDGELVHVSPADPPHGTRHAQIAALVEAHTGPELEVAADMLTRTTEIDDVAPDVSVFPVARDPVTGRRQLEQLAFEVVSTVSLARAGVKAGKLAARGVRRVFAIDVERSRALEWSAVLGAWCELDAAGHIDDPALAVPLPIETMIHAARVDDAVARALLAKRNPVLEAVRANERAEGWAEGWEDGWEDGRVDGRIEGRDEARAEARAEALIVILAARGLPPDLTMRARILGERDLERLGRWIARAIAGATMAELFTEP